MIYLILMSAFATGILVVGQPRSYGATYWNRTMMVLFFWTIVAAVLDCGFGISIKDLF